MDVLQLSPKALQVPENFQAILVGASETGKTHFLENLICHKSKVFPSPGYAKFIYCSPHMGGAEASSARDWSCQQRLEELAKPAEILFFDHIVTESELFEQADATDGNVLLVIDDFSQEIFSSPLTYNLFTKMASHHRIHSCTSLHMGTSSAKPGKWYSLIMQNYNFLVLFRTISNRASIGELSRRIFPYGKNFLQRCLEESTRLCGDYAYVFVDAKLTNPLNKRWGVRTNLFEEHGLPMLMFKSPNVYKH